MSEVLTEVPTFAPPPTAGGLGRAHVLPPKPPERSETGVWVGMSAIMMCFAAITSAMIVRQGASPDWRHFEIPRLLYVNTLILLASSFTLLRASSNLSSLPILTSLSPGAGKRFFAEGMHWLRITLALGGLFLVGQFLAWRVLVSEGVFLSTNPSSSFFYVFTVMHALHLVGGVGGLAYILFKMRKTNGTGQTTGLPAVSLYWHFMDGLWIYLFVLLMARI